MTAKTPRNQPASGRSGAMKGLLQRSMSAEEAAAAARFDAARPVIEQTGGSLLASSAAPRLVGMPALEAGQGSHAPEAVGDTLPAHGVMTIPIDRVHDNPENSRQCYPNDQIEELATLLSQYGQLEPAQAMPHPERPGHWMLLSGHKRMRALLRAGKAEILILPQPAVFGVDRYKRSLAFNAHSRETPLDNARSWQKLLDAGHAANLDDLVDHLGISKSVLSKTLAFNKLPNSAIVRMRENPEKFGTTHAQYLVQIEQSAGEDKLLEYVELIIEDRITTRQLEAAAQAAGVEKAPRKAKQNSRQYRVKVGDVEVGVIRDWDNGRVELEVTLEDAQTRAKLVELLKRELGVQAA